MGQFDSILWSSRNFYCQVLPMVWEIVYITTFRIRVNSSSACPMFSKLALLIAVLGLTKYLKCDVGNLFPSVTYIIGGIAPMIHLLGVRWCRVFFHIFERICDEGGRRLSGTEFYAF